MLPVTQKEVNWTWMNSTYCVVIQHLCPQGAIKLKNSKNELVWNSYVK